MKYSKRGAYTYINEAFVRFNFNSFYVNRDIEGLD